MERINLALGAFSQRARSLVVRHTQTGLTRGLERGEQVEVSDGSSSWIATVADIDFELADTVYRLELPAAPISDVAPPRIGPLHTSDVVALLHDLAALGTTRVAHPSPAPWPYRVQA